ncbi:uncharacterized protein LOC130759555 [Actinidia eriantha]|uniref:uncharacterized protein LOC130759555 n=1 Tax=Actinidia eriantha TaxID=165200 RepID=UPI002582DF5F|nr:uncharacterized protein LOC130759555 [Actinidia eriantha]
MKVVSLEEINSKVRGKNIRVTPDTIATYLHYTRPSYIDVEYPKSNYSSLPEADYAQAIYENPSEFLAGRKFVLGKFKPGYKLMTKIIHYNISPTRSEKELKLADAEFLYVMMNSFVIDIADYILMEMVTFKEKAMRRANLPFVAMVTLCASAGVPFGRYIITPPPVGPITLASVHKSKAMSYGSKPHPVPANIDIASTSTEPPKQKKKSWNTAIMNFMKKLDRKLDFCIKVAEQQSGTKYVEEESDEEKDAEKESDDEEEKSEYS